MYCVNFIGIRRVRCFNDSKLYHICDVSDFESSYIYFVCKIPLLARRIRPKGQARCATIGYLVYKYLLDFTSDVL